jgi:hypothetical protein
MPALVAGIHVLIAAPHEDVDGRNKSGHDELWRAIAARLRGCAIAARSRGRGEMVDARDLKADKYKDMEMIKINKNNCIGQ